MVLAYPKAEPTPSSKSMSSLKTSWSVKEDDSFGIYLSLLTWSWIGNHWVANIFPSLQWNFLGKLYSEVFHTYRLDKTKLSLHFLVSETKTNHQCLIDISGDKKKKKPFVLYNPVFSLSNLQCREEEKSLCRGFQRHSAQENLINLNSRVGVSNHTS